VGKNNLTIHTDIQVREKAWELSNKAVAGALDGLRPIKMHCPVLAEEGIHKAINDYRAKKGLEPWVEKNPHSHEHEDMSCQHEGSTTIQTQKVR